MASFHPLQTEIQQITAIERKESFLAKKGGGEGRRGVLSPQNRDSHCSGEGKGTVVKIDKTTKKEAQVTMCG